MIELNVDEQMANLLWEASRERRPAVLTVFHDGRLIQFRLGIQSTEVTKHGPTRWRHKECTVKLGLVQMDDAVLVEDPPADTSVRDAVHANR